jgi:hypothetical protein
MIGRCWSVEIATCGNAGVGPNLRERMALGGAVVFEVSRQGIATGHAIFEETVPPDWDR